MDVFVTINTAMNCTWMAKVHDVVLASMVIYMVMITIFHSPWQRIINTTPIIVLIVTIFIIAGFFTPATFILYYATIIIFTALISTYPLRIRFIISVLGIIATIPPIVGSFISASIMTSR
ncbi:hypothetical protein NADFUDRAFT_71217 [Nadsonia fulvescens var. elongata DSM 6958]|uniref:Uncharacterized protein n=1 Tax=Nadsonia fulvescens var. elongata DSM 6958 TaxID=857566 RepID=A0A1E3PIR4_9ASCO|nr:hypothetical protein NADFUDRAFT_71217 [Nadsonia fulvescens var. elongata DSM 6958]